MSQYNHNARSYPASGGSYTAHSYHRTGSEFPSYHRTPYTTNSATLPPAPNRNYNSNFSKPQEMPRSAHHHPVQNNTVVSHQPLPPPAHPREVSKSVSGPNIESSPQKSTTDPAKSGNTKPDSPSIPQTAEDYKKKYGITPELENSIRVSLIEKRAKLDDIVDGTGYLNLRNQLLSEFIGADTLSRFTGPGNDTKQKLLCQLITKILYEQNGEKLLKDSIEQVKEEDSAKNKADKVLPASAKISHDQYSLANRQSSNLAEYVKNNAIIPSKVEAKIAIVDAKSQTNNSEPTKHAEVSSKSKEKSGLMRPAKPSDISAESPTSDIQTIPTEAMDFLKTHGINFSEDDIHKESDQKHDDASQFTPTPSPSKTHKPDNKTNLPETKQLMEIKESKDSHSQETESRKDNEDAFKDSEIHPWQDLPEDEVFETGAINPEAAEALTEEVNTQKIQDIEQTLPASPTIVCKACKKDITANFDQEKEIKCAKCDGITCRDCKRRHTKNCQDCNEQRCKTCWFASDDTEEMDMQMGLCMPCKTRQQQKQQEEEDVCEPNKEAEVCEHNSQQQQQEDDDEEVPEAPKENKEQEEESQKEQEEEIVKSPKNDRMVEKENPTLLENQLSSSSAEEEEEEVEEAPKTRTVAQKLNFGNSSDDDEPVVESTTHKVKESPKTKPKTDKAEKKEKKRKSKKQKVDDDVSEELEIIKKLVAHRKKREEVSEGEAEEEEEEQKEQVNQPDSEENDEDYTSEAEVIDQDSEDEDEDNMDVAQDSEEENHLEESNKRDKFLEEDYKFVSKKDKKRKHEESSEEDDYEEDEEILPSDEEISESSAEEMVIVSEKRKLPKRRAAQQAQVVIKTIEAEILKNKATFMSEKELNENILNGFRLAVQHAYQPSYLQKISSPGAIKTLNQKQLADRLSFALTVFRNSGDLERRKSHSNILDRLAISYYEEIKAINRNAQFIWFLEKLLEPRTTLVTSHMESYSLAPDLVMNNERLSKMELVCPISNRDLKNTKSACWITIEYYEKEGDVMTKKTISKAVTVEVSDLLYRFYWACHVAEQVSDFFETNSKCASADLPVPSKVKQLCAMGEHAFLKNWTNAKDWLMANINVDSYEKVAASVKRDLDTFKAKH